MSTIKSFLERGILISPEIAKNNSLIEKLSELDDEKLEGVAVINKDFLLKHKLLTEEAEEREEGEVKRKLGSVFIRGVTITIISPE